jgi:hypothetical protein
MAVWRRTVKTLRVYETELTDEQYEFYKNDEDDEFFDLYMDELIKDEQFIDEDVLDEWIDVVV